jgi:hypothetical protein
MPSHQLLETGPMPTFDRSDEFIHDWSRLSPEQRDAFKAAVRQFVADLKSGSGVRTALGVKRFRSVPGVWEFAWASDGRALFRYGTSPHQGDVHIVWLRVGAHDIYR